MGEETKEAGTDHPFMTIYKPIAYTQAVCAGAVVVLSDSKLARMARKWAGTEWDRDNLDLGTPKERFQKGYDFVLRVYGYNN